MRRFAALLVMFVACVTLTAQNCITFVSNKPGDTIQITATLSTIDVNENGEGEPLALSSSGGEPQPVIAFYSAPQTSSYVATQANETIVGTIIGFDGDESCSISAIVTNSPKYTPAQKQAFTNAANQLNVIAAETAIFTALCGGLAIIPGVGTVPAVICGVPMGVVSGGTWLASAKFSQMAADPPDPNFMQIALPVIPIVPPAQFLPIAVAAAYNDFIADLAQIVGLQDALITSLNRASGAKVANNTFWFEQQDNAANTYNDKLALYLAKAASAAGALQVALQANGGDYTLTAAQVRAFELYVSQNGLPAGVLAGLRAFLASPSDISLVTSIAIVQNVNVVAGPLNGPAGLFANLFGLLTGTSRALGGLAVVNYQLVSQQPVTGPRSFVTYRADLLNPGAALGSVAATLTNLDPFTVRAAPGQGTLTFSPVAGNSQVASANTFTIIVDPSIPFDPTKLQWIFATTPAPPAANPGPNQLVKVGSTVSLNGSGSTNPSGVGTLTYSWRFTSRPPGTSTKLFYSDVIIPTFIADAPGTYQVTLTVSNGTASSSAVVSVTATP